MINFYQKYCLYDGYLINHIQIAFKSFWQHEIIITITTYAKISLSYSKNLYSSESQQAHCLAHFLIKVEKDESPNRLPLTSNGPKRNHEWIAFLRMTKQKNMRLLLFISSAAAFVEKVFKQTQVSKLECQLFTLLNRTTYIRQIVKLLFRILWLLTNFCKWDISFKISQQLYVLRE